MHWKNIFYACFWSHTKGRCVKNDEAGDPTRKSKKVDRFVKYWRIRWKFVSSISIFEISIQFQVKIVAKNVSTTTNSTVWSKSKYRCSLVTYKARKKISIRNVVINDIHLKFWFLRHIGISSIFLDAAASLIKTWRKTFFFVVKNARQSRALTSIVVIRNNKKKKEKMKRGVFRIAFSNETIISTSWSRLQSS